MRFQVFMVVSVKNAVFWEVRRRSLVECMISGYSHEVNDNCTLLGFYAASSVNFLLKFQDPFEEPAASISRVFCPKAKSSRFLQYVGKFLPDRLTLHLNTHCCTISDHNFFPIISENELAPSSTWIPTVNRELPIRFSFLGKGVVKWMSQWSQGHLSGTSSVYGVLCVISHL